MERIKHGEAVYLAQDFWLKIKDLTGLDKPAHSDEASWMKFFLQAAIPHERAGQHMRALGFESEYFEYSDLTPDERKRWSATLMADCKRFAGKQQTAKQNTPPKPTINVQMLEVLQKNPKSAGWTSGEWATHLKCATSTLTKTDTWKLLSDAASDGKTARKKDRHRKPKASEKRASR